VMLKNVTFCPNVEKDQFQRTDLLRTSRHVS
jgi:hypothetical protein